MEVVFLVAGSDRALEPFFELRRGIVTDPGVTTMRIYQPSMKSRMGHPCLHVIPETGAVEQLAFERGEETLGHCVVVSISHRSRRRFHTGLLATLAEGDRRVLTPLVGMMKHASCCS